MSDLYSEILIERLPNPRDIYKRIALILLLAACLVGYVTVSWLFLFGIIATGIAIYIIFPKFHVEYEYLILNNALDVDAIYSRKKRKKMAQYDLNNMELLAPYHSHRLDRYNNNPQVKMRNFSSMDRHNPPYVMIINDNGQILKVLLQLDQETVENMRMFHPSKVFHD